MARFKNMIRAVARITISRGQGRGAALGIIRLRPSAGGEEKLRAALREKLDPGKLDGIISMHLIESDPVLSKPLTDNPSDRRSRRRRLVCPDRCHRCERDFGRISGTLRRIGFLRREYRYPQAVIV